MGISFRFRPIPFVATVLLVALGVSLGQWQDRRALEKTTLQQKLTARGAEAPLALGAALLPAAPLEYRNVRVTGEFVAGWPVYLNNRPQDGRAGFYLVMPLRIVGTDTHVLVARGWLPRNTAEATRLPPYATPAGTVTVDGIVKASVGRVMQLGTPEPVKPGAIVQNIDPAEFAKASGLKLQPFFIEQAGPAPAADGLVRSWPAPSLGVEKHQGYAFQWYALAAMALLFFVITGFRRGTDQSKQSN
ncbi:cytochrome oxidase biosynthesis protein [Massilia eurypsychrophila]|jgi:surfeit locus 1 family protein|uniref:SURF1-like protein n=1 Tax=Massilia eurypsychrophila TaxID=1485217 RepID=A0A2G8TH49_9BURK|nr:SURF1 family protein [Massilia eurypsychrophila]PIL45380.1 cytochrome oxidase biosynthesis protein [Massilia eurypsychrophila]